MAVKLKLSGRLPALDLDGLSAVAPAIHDNPEQSVYVVAELKLNDIIYHQLTGDVSLAMGIERIEVARTHDAAKVADVLRHTSEKRTGRIELPGFNDGQGESVLVEPEDDDL